jgi:chromosomal replication initiator protein
MTDTILWDKCLDAFNSVLSEKQMRTWFHPLEVIRKDKTLNVIAPNKFVKDVIENDFLLLIKDTVLSKSSNQVSEILLSLPTPQNTQQNKFGSAATNKKHQTSLNKDLTFENFVEGKSNQLAKAACSSVVTKLGQYNPLYIYGGVGLGKTHLLHSIGNEIIKVDKSKKVVYLHSEKFVQNMVTALRQNKIEEFKKYYRSVDALLLDDIQFFANKERSQEEFFHTFNSLFEYKKQVVLTSDKYPKEIAGLEERIKSRLVWGMNVTIEPPDLETRVAILHKKAGIVGETIPDDVAFFLAKNVYSNVRELEGSLRRVIATAHFKREEISLVFVKETLKDLISLQERLLTIDHIQKTVAEYYKVRVSDIISAKRDKKITLPRHVAMALSKELTSHSLPSIGDAFGGRDHTTVLHACKKIMALKTPSSSLSQDYQNIIHSLNN